MSTTPDETIEQVRKLLKEWDDGLVSRAEFECNIQRPLPGPLLGVRREGRDVHAFRLVLLSVHPRAREAMELRASRAACILRFTHVRGRRWNYGDPDREHVLSFDEEGT